jgi:hypothetical protein
MTFSTLKAFEPLQLAATAGDIYTVPATPSTKTVNFRVRLVNTDTSTQAVTLYAVPSGGTAGVGNVCFQQTLAVGGPPVDVDVPVLKSGDTLQGLAGTANKVTVHHLSGLLDQ